MHASRCCPGSGPGLYHTHRAVGADGRKAAEGKRQISARDFNAEVGVETGSDREGEGRGVKSSDDVLVSPSLRFESLIAQATGSTVQPLDLLRQRTVDARKRWER